MLDCDSTNGAAASMLPCGATGKAALTEDADAFVPPALVAPGSGDSGCVTGTPGLGVLGGVGLNGAVIVGSLVYFTAALS